MKLGIFSVLIILLFCAFISYGVQKGIIQFPQKNLKIYGIFNPYANSNNYNQTQVNQYLLIAKNLSLHGVGIYGLEGYIGESKLEDVLSLVDYYGFDAYVYINWLDVTTDYTNPECWNQTGFPFNETQVNAFLEYVEDIANISKNYRCVKAYILQYPYWFNANLTYWMENIVSTPEYKQNFQTIINTIKQNDPQREIYIASDMIERWFGSFQNSLLPYNLANITGFAFSCYFEPERDGNIEGYLNKLQNYYDFFKAKSNQYAKGKIIISELGFKTYPYAIRQEGLVSDENSKKQYFSKVLNKIKGWNTTLCYFMIHDFPKENEDWGIINNDYSFRPIADAIIEFNQNKEWYQEPLTCGITIFLIVFGVFAFKWVLDNI